MRPYVTLLNIFSEITHMLVCRINVSIGDGNPNNYLMTAECRTTSRKPVLDECKAWVQYKFTDTLRENKDSWKGHKFNLFGKMGQRDQSDSINMHTVSVPRCWLGTKTVPLGAPNYVQLNSAPRGTISVPFFFWLKNKYVNLKKVFSSKHFSFPVCIIYFSKLIWSNQP